jgi:hypothetical protein
VSLASIQEAPTLQSPPDHQHRNSTAVIQIMSPVLQKIFMLQRHQLIRWGSVIGYLCTGIGVMSMIASIFLLQAFNSKFEEIDERLHDNAKLERQVIDSKKSMDELITFTLKSSEDRKNTLLDLSEMSLSAIQLSLLLFALLGFLLLGYGILSLRAKELALEADQQLRES